MLPKSSEANHPQSPARRVLSDVLASLETSHGGADFSRDVFGRLRWNIVPDLVQGDPEQTLTLEDSRDVIRDLCTYTARRIAAGTATIIDSPATIVRPVSEDQTRPLTATDLGTEATDDWQTLRAPVASLLYDGLEGYRESLIDKPQQTPAADRIQQWQQAIDTLMGEFVDGIAIIPSSDAPNS